jgi:hypothetical protein
MPLMPYKDPEVGRARAAERYQARRVEIRAAAAERWRTDPEHRAKATAESTEHYRTHRGAYSIEKRMERAERVRAITPPPFSGPDGTMVHYVPLFGDHHSVVGFVRVDEDDVDAVMAYRWGLTPKGYAIRTDRSSGSKTTIVLHRWLTGIPTGDPRQGDHINGDTLDCTRRNLRVLLGEHNAQNRRSHGPVPFRGVYYSPVRSGKSFVANCRINGKQVRLGRYATAEEAAEVALAARREHMPYAVERD